MTLQEILDDVDSRISNAVSNTLKVKWINQIQRQLFRDYPLPEAVDKFTTVSGVQFYPMPDKCAEGRITGLTVNGVKYDYQMHLEEAKEQFWTIVAGQIMLYPVPDGAYDVMVYYRPRHNELSETRLSEVPNFPEDYHELLVLGCAKRVAQTQRDVDLANNFEADFKELAAEAAVIPPTLFIRARPPSVGKIRYSVPPIVRPPSTTCDIGKTKRHYPAGQQQFW